jgi:HTH-type transcriptional regulator/antitoxin HigA
VETLMDRKVIDDITARFLSLAEIVPLQAIRNVAGYDKAVAVLNQLLDAGAADEHSPLADLTNALGGFIAEYEDVHHLPVEVSPAATLRFLMEQHALSQSDLSGVGSQGVVSEILRGKRELNIRQIKELARLFQVPATLFI